MHVRKNKTLLDKTSDYVDTVRPQVESAAVTAKEAVQEFVETTAKPAIKDARAKAGPALSDARDKAAPVVAASAAKASKKAKEAKEAANAAVAQARGEQPKKRGKLKKFALFAAVAGAVGFVASKLRGGKESQNWQSSYVPSPAPGAKDAPATKDVGGASPDEALADAAEEPHAVTTPEDPATLVDVEGGKGEEPRP